MTAVVPHGEIIPSSLPTALPVARAWLYGYVRSDHPGYRSMRIDGAPAIVASTTGQRWDTYIAALSTALAAAGGGTAAIQTDGRVRITGDGGFTIEAVDRLGWLAGMTTDAGKSRIGNDEILGLSIPSAGIPLFGAQWERVSVEREREIAKDRSRRQGGYVWGGARVWVWVLTMHRYALDALLTGWCLRGTVSILGAGVSATMGSSEPGGAFTGSALGLDGSPVWSGPTNQIATVRLIVAGTTT